ncbi:MAG: NADH-quinone oxidoreductase subunit K [Planctomycetes bacterium]|nr:NADH-quinone oxidoreductase subunit K [Planctomycetota bacterium]
MATFCYWICLMLFAVGLYCIVTKRNLIKIVIGVAIMDHAVNLFLVLLGYRLDGMAPILDRAILSESGSAAGFAAKAVDPLPQAMVLTSIVISLAVTALLVALCVRIYEKYGTYDVNELRRLRG